MSDSDASCSSDDAWNCNGEEDESLGNDEQRHPALDLQFRKPQGSSSNAGTQLHVSKMERYLSNLISDPQTQSSISEFKQEDQTLRKRFSSSLPTTGEIEPEVIKDVRGKRCSLSVPTTEENVRGKRFSLSLPTTEEIEPEVFKDVRGWMKSEELIRRDAIGDNSGEEAKEAVDSALFDKFKKDTTGTARIKFLKRKLADATVGLAAYAREIVEETFESALQEVTSAVWRELQDARDRLRQCALADDLFRSKTAEMEEQIRQCVHMQTKYLREVSVLRDQLDHGRSEQMGDIRVAMWNPLEDLDAETRALVIACTEEQLKAGFITASDLQGALESKLKAAEEALVLEQKKTSCQAICIARLREELHQYRSKPLKKNISRRSSDSTVVCISKRSIEELVLTQNKTCEQATDIVKLRERLDQHRSKPSQDEISPISADSKAGVTCDRSMPAQNEISPVSADSKADMTSERPIEELALAQNKTSEQAMDIAELRQELDQHGGKPSQDEISPVSSDSKADITSERPISEILCDVCGARVAIPAHFVTNAQKTSTIPVAVVTATQKNQSTDTAAKLPGVHSAIPADCVTEKQNCREAAAKMPFAPRAGQPRVHSKRRQSSTDAPLAESGCQSHEQAHKDHVQDAERCADESNKQSGLPVNACAPDHGNDGFEQSANSGQQESKQDQDVAQTVRAAGRRITHVLDAENPQVSARRKSSLFKNKTLGSATFDALDSEGLPAKHRGPQDNPAEKAFFLVSGSSASRRASLPSSVPPPSNGKAESPLTQAAHDSAADVHNKPGSPPTRPSGQAAVRVRRDSRLSMESTSCSSFESGLQVGGTAMAVIPSGLEGSGGSHALPKQKQCQEDHEVFQTPSSGRPGPQLSRKWHWIRPQAQSKKSTQW